MLKQRKGQLTLADAPTVVLIVGLVFLIMATMAFISSKMGDSLAESDRTSVTVTNETGAFVNYTTFTVDDADQLGFKDFVITQITNSTNGTTGFLLVVSASNYTYTQAGVVTNATTFNFNSANVSYTYTYTPKSTAYNTTVDLNTEIANNTSIAGIVLTISLVGIVLTVLIGVFLVTRGAGAGRA